MPKHPVPTPQHLAWQEAEMGVLIHFDIGVYEPDYAFRERWGYVPPASMFNPVDLDTDQWVKAAVDCGAKYAVLVAKHCIGFTLWPSKSYPYGVAQSPWRDGKGDIVRDFVDSCKKYGIKPGIYCSAAFNAYWNIDNPGRERSGDMAKQQEYNRAVETMVQEIWSNYGELFEIWFDGGVLPPSMGGPELTSHLLRLQPNAVCFQGPGTFPTLIRWGANEEGVAPDPCWACTDMQQPSDATGQGECPLEGTGRPDGTVWAPVEADMTIRDLESFGGGWFWKAGEDHCLYSTAHLLERYEKTVGRGTNLMLGMVIDDRGLVPDVDCARFAELGEAIADKWGVPTIETTEMEGEGTVCRLELPAQLIDRVILQEDLQNGQHIRRWKLEAETNGQRTLLAQGESMGHKRFASFGPIQAAALILTAETDGEPTRIRKLAAFAAK